MVIACRIFKRGLGIFPRLETLRFHLESPALSQPFGKIVDAEGKAVNPSLGRGINVRGAVGEGALQDTVFLDDNPLVEFRDEIPGEVLIEKAGTFTHGISLSFCMMLSSTMSINHWSRLVR
jgi:hypothetical protein